jgi:hypothetical protein
MPSKECQRGPSVEPSADLVLERAFAAVEDSSFSGTAELRTAVRAYVDVARAQNESPQRALDGIREIARAAGLRTPRTLSLPFAPITADDVVLARTIIWCFNRCDEIDASGQPLGSARVQS